ncbi:MAG: YdaS family helix-turn-helix protein [Methylotenera sp.]|nr:YdaS family helix-turn-helix protein [Methylotenera sp.]
MNLKKYIKDNSQVTFARSLGISQAMVSKWYRGYKVSGDSALKVSAATDWQVTPHELRPDIYPHPHDGLPEHLRA